MSLDNFWDTSFQLSEMGVTDIKYVDFIGNSIRVIHEVMLRTLRRTFGPNLYEETNDTYLVADALHHASVETTKRHYARMSKDHKKIAEEKSSYLFKK